MGVALPASERQAWLQLGWGELQMGVQKTRLTALEATCPLNRESVAPRHLAAHHWAQGLLGLFGLCCQPPTAFLLHPSAGGQLGLKNGRLVPRSHSLNGVGCRDRLGGCPPHSAFFFPF